MSECTADGCNIELSGGIMLCHDHTTKLEEALQEVPGTWRSITVSACKPDVGADSVGGMGGEASGSEPANLDALDKGDQLLTVLRGWSCTHAREGTTRHRTRLRGGILMTWSRETGCPKSKCPVSAHLRLFQRWPGG